MLTPDQLEDAHVSRIEETIDATLATRGPKCTSEVTVHFPFDVDTSVTKRVNAMLAKAGWELIRWTGYDSRKGPSLVTFRAKKSGRT